MKKNTAEALCRNKEQLCRHIREKLAAHTPRYHIFDATQPSVPASVLIPLFFKDGRYHLLFTKRTDTVEHHKGQISFPGGRQDGDDPDALFTALRETEEEVGIAPQNVTILGQCDGMLTNTLYLLTPFVGCYTPPAAYRISVNEIDRLIEAPLEHFLDDSVFYTEKRTYKGHTWSVHYYRYGDDVIWGVTGFILSAFLNRIFDIGRPVE